MGKIKKFLTSDVFFVVLVCSLALFISFYPSIYEIQNAFRAFPDRYFILVHNFAADYHAYLSKIIQGLQGHWLVREYFTSEAHQGSLLQIFYLLLGQAGRIFSANAEQVYHASRLIFGLGWLLAGWWFIKFSFANKLYRKIAFLIFVFVANWPKIVTSPNGYGFPFLGQKWETTLVGWSNLDIVKRITFVPHWNAGHILTVASLLLFVKFLKSKKYRDLVLSGVVGLIAGFVLPPTLIIVYVILGLWVVCEIIKFWGTRSVATHLSLFIGLFVYFIFTFPSLLYNLWVTQFYPWKALVETDLYVNKIVFPYWNYLIGLGPTAFLGLAAIPLVFLLKKEKLYWSAFWVLGMFLLIFVFDKFIIWHNQTRFIEVGPELPLAVLSVVTLSSLAQFFGKIKRVILIFFTILLFFPSIFLMIVSVKAQTDFIDHKLAANYPSLSFGNYVVYPTRDFMEGVFFLAKNTTEKEVILSGPTSGNHIAAYAGRFVYIGHGSQTVRFYEEKLPAVTRFYSGQMADKEAKKFLQDNRVTDVFFGPEEKQWGDWVRKKPFLELVYINGEVRIYKVK